MVVPPRPRQSRTMGNVATTDAIVVGLGAVGSAVAHHLAAGGARVVGIDRFAPPHDQGSSHGLTRITRLAVGEGAAFVPLVMRSHALWPALEAASGETLHRRTGGLVIGSAEADVAKYHGQPGFLAQTVALAERCYFEHDAGVLFPERIVAAQLAAARRHGATLRLGERVDRVRPGAGGVEVITDRGRLSAARVVVTAGAWAPGLAGNAFGDTRLRVLRQVLWWFEVEEPGLYAPERCPVFIWLHGSGGRRASMYGFPMIDGVAGPKVASEQDTVESDPDRVDRQVSDADAQAIYEDHARSRLRGITPRLLRSATCLYTSSPDASFLVRPHPDTDAVSFVSACSGHGFKHSAALGEALAM